MLASRLRSMGDYRDHTKQQVSSRGVKCFRMSKWMLIDGPPLYAPPRHVSCDEVVAEINCLLKADETSLANPAAGVKYAQPVAPCRFPRNIPRLIRWARSRIALLGWVLRGAGLNSATGFGTFPSEDESLSIAFLSAATTSSCWTIGRPLCRFATRRLAVANSPASNSNPVVTGFESPLSLAAFERTPVLSDKVWWEGCGGLFSFGVRPFGLS